MLTPLLQLSLVIGLVALIVAAYWLHPASTPEVNQAMAVLVSGDGAGHRRYLHGYGIWAPVASIFLMILQAVPVPAILSPLPMDSRSVSSGADLTVAGQTIAAVVCFAIARALGDEGR